MSISAYSLTSYGDMIADKDRMRAFDAALRRAIVPGCTVIDIGTGPGHMAMLACRYGAGHVFAIEPFPLVDLARQIANENGFADRMTFVQDFSTHWAPPEPADVVVSDIRGVLPLYEHHIPCIVDMRKRLLKPGGIQIPGRDTLYAALVEAPDIHMVYSTPWLDSPFGIDMSSAYPFVIGSWTRVSLPPERLLSDQQEFCTLDYTTITSPDVSGTMKLYTKRRGTAHGILIWSETDLLDGIRHSNAPGQPEKVYGQAFLPFQNPVLLSDGACAYIELSATFVDSDYVFTWAISVDDRDGRAVRLKHNSLQSNIMDRKEMAVRASNFCPPVRAEYEVDAWLLRQFDGRTDLDTIAEALQDKFPIMFPSKKSALDHAASLSARYKK